MVWQRTPYALPLLVVAGVCLSLSVALGRSAGEERTPPGTRAYLVLGVGTAAWAAASALQYASADLGSKLFWYGVSWLGFAVVAVAWPGFVFAHLGEGEDVSWPVAALLAVVPTLAVVAVWLPPYRWLVFGDATLVATPGDLILSASVGPLGIAFIGYTAALALAATGALLRVARRSWGPYRLQALALLVVGTLSTLGGLAFALGVGPTRELNPAPVGFAVTTVVAGWGLATVRPRDLVAAAERVVQDRFRDGMLVLDAHGRVVEADAVARRLFDGGTGLVGEPAASVFADHPQLLDHLDAPADRPIDISVEQGVEQLAFEVFVVPLSDGRGRLAGRVLFLWDVTERRRHEQRLQVLNRVLRHDLRNHVNIIQGNAELLLGEIDGDEARTEAQAIIETSRDLVALSNKARLIEASHGRGRRSHTVDLVDCVERALRNVREDEADVAVLTDLPESEPVNADVMISAALENLIENAVEHNDDGTPSVWVSLDRTMVDGREYAELSVGDDGPGIPEKERQILREGIETPLEHTSGLGLWLVNWIVTRSKGDLRFEEKEPRGSVVTIRLPLVRSGEESN